MNIKCIAIGNRIMGDDGIGIKILEELSYELKKLKIEVIFGETDIDYTLAQINYDDMLFIIDSTYLNIVPGTVTFMPIEEAVFQLQPQIYSQHQPSLIHLLQMYKKSVSGYIIGIEAAEIKYSLIISEQLNKKFINICDDILTFIKQILGGL